MGGIPELRIGLATLPAQQPADASREALGLIFTGRCVPTVPVLPTAGSTLLAQSAGAFEGVRELRTGSLHVDLASFGVRPAEAVTLHGPAFDMTRDALAAWPQVELATGPAAVRIDMVGPVSLAFELIGAGVPRAQALDAARMASVYRSEALFRACRSAEPILPVIVVMIEGRLVGSAHPTFPFTAREVRSLLDPVVESLDSAAGTSDVVIGVHVPGRADLRTIISSGVSLVSMPPEPSVVGWAPWIQALLDNGGHIAWGAVPVDRPLGTNAELLWRHLAATWRDLEAEGVDRELMVRRSLVTPSSGLAGFGVEQVPGVVALVDSLAERVGEQATRARTPVLV